jgi:tRNA(Leu) C34 or U34 (ribose-2'-O)-methylase TrmL
VIASSKIRYQQSAGPGVILIDPKYVHNVAAAIRAASCFDITRLVWTGFRVDLSGLDRLPREERMKGYRDVVWNHDPADKPFRFFAPGVTPVCVELLEKSEPLTTFVHPDNGLYVFGPEDGGVPQAIRGLCHRFVHIPASHCLNLAAALNVVLYDRKAKRQIAGLDAILPTGQMLREHRGPMEIPGMPGWDGY